MCSPNDAERLARDQFIEGCKSDIMRKAVYNRPELTIEEALRWAQSIERSINNMSNMKDSHPGQAQGEVRLMEHTGKKRERQPHERKEN